MFLKALLILSVLTPVYSFADTGIQPETLGALKTLRAKIRAWAPVCDGTGELTYHECPFRDGVEHMGLLCLSGDQHYCDLVKQSQDESGRWWRSPGLVGLEDTAFSPGGASFSRDMGYGVQAYLVATHDTEAAQKWVDYIIGNHNYLCAKPNIARNWSVCRANFMLWSQLTDIYDYLGLPRTRRMGENKSALDALVSTLGSIGIPRDYNMIMMAEELYIRQELKKRGAKIHHEDADGIAKSILHARDPENPYYAYLALGQTESVAQKVLKYCPSEKPVTEFDLAGARFNVEFARPMKERVYEQSGGHMCIFLINVLTGSAND